MSIGELFWIFLIISMPQPVRRRRTVEYLPSPHRAPDGGAPKEA